MGVIINNEYYPDKAPSDRSVDTSHSTYKQWNHEEQRKNHAREIVQPFTRDGKPNPAFIEAFPTESRERGFLPSDDKLKEL